MHSTEPYLLNQDSGIMDAIFFSPHLDDAVLSVGNIILDYIARRKRIAIVTLFSEANTIVTSQAIRQFLSESGHTSGTSLFHARKNEDRKALQILRVPCLAHLGYTDALFRHATSGSTPLYPTFRDIRSGIIVRAEGQLIQSLTKKLAYIQQRHVRSQTQIYAPLGVGRHVDHVLVHNIVTSIFADRVKYWEDIPYRSNPESLFSRIATLKYIGITRGRSIRCSPKFAEKKERAVEAYASQTSGLYKNGLGPIDFLYETIYEIT